MHNNIANSFVSMNVAYFFRIRTVKERIPDIINDFGFAKLRSAKWIETVYSMIIPFEK